jgi:hypothetical protein
MKAVWKSDMIMATWNVRTMLCYSRPESIEGKTVDGENERQRAMETDC